MQSSTIHFAIINMYVFMPSVRLRLRQRAVLRNVKFESFWLAAGGAEWASAWDDRVFTGWNKSDLLKNDRVLTSRYLDKKATTKRSAKNRPVFLC
jgi:hypothetical protein